MVETAHLIMGLIMVNRSDYICPLEHLSKPISVPSPASSAAQQDQACSAEEGPQVCSRGFSSWTGPSLALEAELL